MARKKNPTDVLKPCSADDVFRRITAWHQADNPSPEELIDWLNHVTEQLEKTVATLHTDKDQICRCDESVRLRATSVVMNALDFLDRADVTAELLTGVVGGRVRDAFLEGLRLGLLYEKLMSLIDGRYADYWQNQKSRQGGAGAANEAHAELHRKYQADVDKAMADGVSYTAACQSVSRASGVNERTVRNHTRNPAPRNRGRHAG